MSPARARTSSDAIVAAGRALLETGGLDAVTMQAVADKVGVKAPSLYKRVASRQALIHAIATDVAAELQAAIAPGLGEDDPADGARRVADGYRAFARRSPGAYQLLFTALLPDANPTPTANAGGSVRPPRADRAPRRPRPRARGGSAAHRLRPRVREHGAGGRVPARRRRRRGLPVRGRRDHRRPARRPVTFERRASTGRWTWWFGPIGSSRRSS